jgi:tetratricopeptide (TPR) repeat protein
VGAGTAEVFAAAEDAEQTAKALQYAMVVAVAGAERAALLRRTAQLRLASDADAAFDDAMAALREDPRNPDNFALLEETAQAADRWNELVLTLQTIAEGHGDAALEAQLFERASVYAATRLHDTEESLQLLRLAVERAPSDDGWQKLQTAFLAAGQPQQWADVLLKRREDASGGAERTHLLYDWLTLTAELGLPAEVRIGLLRDGLQDAPADERLLNELESLCTEVGDWDGVADAMQERLDAASDPDERFSLACQLANLHTGQRADAAAAADAWRVALSAQDGNVAALESFAAVLSDLQEWSELATTLEQLAEHYSDDVAAAHDAWRRLALLQLEQLDDPSAALRSVEHVLDTDPADAECIALLWRIGTHEPAAIDLLDTLTSHNGDATDRIRLLELRIAQEPDPAERARRSFELANLTESSTGDEELAFHYRCEAATMEPDNEAWLNGVLASATVPARVPRAAAVLEAVIENATSPAERRIRRLQLASLWLEVAGDKDGAIEPLREQLSENPADVDAFELLLPLYDATADTSQRMGLLLDHAAALPGHTGDQYRWQAVRLTEAVTRDAAQALAILQQIAPGAVRDEAFDHIAESAGLMDELLADLHERVGHADDEVARGALWLRIAGLLLADTGRMVEAIQAFEQASQCAGAEDEALEGLVSLWSSRDALPELCDTLARQIARADDPGLRSSLVRYRLDVAQQLGDRPTVIAMLEALLEYDPADDDAATLLIAALVAEQRWQEAVAQLRRASEREIDGSRRRAIWMQTADIAADSMSDFELAESLWRRVAADAPGSPEADRALQGLVRLVEKRGDPDAAIHMLLDILSAPIVPSSSGPMWEQLGNLMRQQNRPASEWMDAWNRALLAGHVSQKMLEDMERNVQGTGDTDRLLTLYATASRAGLIRSDRRRRWADLLVSARRFDEAIAALEAGVREGDTDPGLSSQLVTLMLERGQADAAAAALDAWADRPSTRNSRAEQPLIVHLRGRLALARGNPKEALEAYRRSFSLDPSFVPNLVALGILHLGQQENEEALRVLQTALQHQNRIDNDRLRLELFFRLAEVRQRTGDLARARDMLQRALAIDANYEPARRLARELG